MAVGAFTLVAGPHAINTLIDKFGSIAPADAASLLRDSLRRLDQKPSTGIVMTIVTGRAGRNWSTASRLSKPFKAQSA